jgi:hypothetical protein
MLVVKVDAYALGMLLLFDVSMSSLFVITQVYWGCISAFMQYRNSLLRLLKLPNYFLIEDNAECAQFFHTIRMHAVEIVTLLIVDADD